MKHGKKYIESTKLFDHLKQYDPEEAVELDEFLDTLDGNILFIRGSLFTPENRLLDSYTDDDCYVILTEQLNHLAMYSANPGKLVLSDGGLPVSGLANSTIGVSANYLDDETVLRKLPFITPDEVEDILLRKTAGEQQTFVTAEEEPEEEPEV